jgi:RNA polymerase sigma factor (sigma-70 family)
MSHLTTEYSKEVSDPEALAVELLRRMALKEREALRAFYQLYARRIGHFLMKLLKRPELVEEAVNDAMLAVWQDAGDFDSAKGKLSIWLFGIAYHQGLKLLERARRQEVEQLLEPESDDDSEDDLTHWIAAQEQPDSSDPLHRILGWELGEILNQALERLSLAHRTVLELTFSEGCTYQDIAEITGVPVSKVLSRLARGRQLLWESLKQMAEISERKRYEEELKLRNRAIEASSVGIIITDARQTDNPIIYANPAFAHITGYTQEELIGRNPRFLQGPGTNPEAVAALRQALRGGGDCHLTLKNYRKDGTPFWNELFISPVWDNEGHLTHFIGTQTDVTELRHAEEERHELEIAKHIQLSLLPHSPLQVEGAHLAGFCLPATHIGGDYFDYFCRQDTLDIVIADVSGHSMGAALIMAETRSTLRAEALRGPETQQPGRVQGTGEILRAVNTLLYEDLTRAELFITMFYMKYNRALRQVSYANAGHNCPLLLRAGETRCRELDADGLIFGVNKDVAFEEKGTVLQKGDLVLLYTDGLTEAQNREGEFFGTDRLGQLLVTQGLNPPQEIINTILQELQAFCRSHSFADDVSMVVLNVT